MSIAAAECPVCFVTDELPPECIFVEGEAAIEGDADAIATWICGQCGQLVDLGIDLSMALMLVSAGARLVDARQRQVSDRRPERDTGGPPFTWDDLLDFHDYLQDESATDLLRDEGPGDHRSRT